MNFLWIFIGVVIGYLAASAAARFLDYNVLYYFFPEKKGE